MESRWQREAQGESGGTNGEESLQKLDKTNEDQEVPQPKTYLSELLYRDGFYWEVELSKEIK